MPTNLFDLSGRVALVTGGSKGLGKAMARAFAEAGDDVAISSRHENELLAAAVEIRQGTDAKVGHFVADMTHGTDVKRLADWAVQSMGKVDILVNNAGSNLPQPIDQVTDDDWDQLIQLNLTSCMALSRTLSTGMKARRGDASSTFPRFWASRAKGGAAFRLRDQDRPHWARACERD